MKMTMLKITILASLSTPALATGIPVEPGLWSIRSSGERPLRFAN